MNLKNQIEQAKSGILLFGITPPHQNNSLEKIEEIAAKTRERINGMDIDGLIIYDINDENDRNQNERPFPYLPTMDPYVYYSSYLQKIRPPVVIYRCVGKYTESQLTGWLNQIQDQDILSVFVGAASGQQKVSMSLKNAYELRRMVDGKNLLGGVLIAERHSKYLSEHLKIEEKQAYGCSFFISQIFYNIDYTKSLLSDYYYHCKSTDKRMVPIILTVSACGSVKTLEFMKWLGINIPRWLENEIIHSLDPLAESTNQCLNLVEETIAFCRRLKIPFGFNVESVSNRRVEIEASIQLVKEIRKMLGKV